MPPKRPRITCPAKTPTTALATANTEAAAKPATIDSGSPQITMTSGQTNAATVTIHHRATRALKKMTVGITHQGYEPPGLG